MVDVNGTVNVTVKLTGDGWALQPNPIDVVLLIDQIREYEHYDE